jgi:hypothetical protein
MYSPRYKFPTEVRSSTIVNIMRGFGRPANFKATRDLLTHKLEETHHVTVEVHNMAIS